MHDGVFFDYNTASSHEKFSFMLLERLEILEKTVNNLSHYLSQENNINHQLKDQIKIQCIRHIIYKYQKQYSVMTSSPLYYFKVLKHALVLWCNQHYIEIDENVIPLYLQEILSFHQKFAYPMKYNPETTYDNMAETERSKVYVAFIFMMLPYEQIQNFDIHDDIPDLNDIIQE